jgi:hypothetical protein
MSRPAAQQTRKATTGATFACILLLSGLCCGQNTTKPIEVALCELYQHPEQYAGKMVKVHAGSVSGLSIENLRHDAPAERCSAFMTLIVVFPNQVKPPPSFRIVQDESYKKLVESLQYPGPIHIDATYEGRFDLLFVWRDHKRISVRDGVEKGYGKKYEYDGRIVLHQVSEVWAMPLAKK